MNRIKEIKPRTKYIIALIGFAIVCGLRFFDRGIVFHSTPLGIMQYYRFAELATAVYFLCFFLLSYYILRKTEEKNEKLMGYIIMFAAVFIFPMFLYNSYFGATDIYGFIIAFFCMFLIIVDKFVFLVPFGCFVITLINPMGIITLIMLLSETLIIRFADTRKYIYLVFNVLSIVLAAVGVIVNSYVGIFATDMQGSLSFTKFIVALFLFIPYMIFSVVFLKRLFVGTDMVKTISYVITMLFGLLGPIVYIVLGDYSRAIFYGFIYYIFTIMIQVVIGNSDFVDSSNNVVEVVNKFVSFPAVVIAYAFIIMTMWISGPVILFEETFIGL